MASVIMFPHGSSVSKSELNPKFAHAIFLSFQSSKYLENRKFCRRKLKGNFKVVGVELMEVPNYHCRRGRDELKEAAKIYLNKLVKFDFQYFINIAYYIIVLFLQNIQFVPSTGCLERKYSPSSLYLKK
ncbi:Hypothetical_protein [Hexamita inflata]|uniref:Hypothetical_protein n=1 Tax=Hexamita inflata TaxID=28002 RepID=A0ABP1J4T2_9EUKA